MKIAILGAMEEEISPILSMLGEYEKIEYAENIYYKSNYAGHDIVLAYSKIGKVNATMTATIMLEKFECKTLLFTGVAGSLNPSLKIGDILYATKTAQHDLDITAFGHPYGYVPGISIFEETSDRLNDLARNIAREEDLNLLGGVVASGDQFICEDNEREWIRQTFGADAVEMEGAAVARVCAAYKIPFFLMRAISDESGKNADVDFNEFLDNSAKISAKFVLKMVENI